MKCGRAKKGNATGVRRIQDMCPADGFLSGSNAITSLGVQSSISHNRPSVYSIHGDGFIMFQVIHRFGRNIMLENQGIGGDVLLLHGFP